MSIRFEAVISNIASRKVIRIPLSSSEKLPSRGLVMIEGTIKGAAFIAPLEPDGNGSHWLLVSDLTGEEAELMTGETVSIQIEPVKDWIEPEIPKDIMDAVIKADLLIHWNSLTVKARWEWLRWIRSTSNPATRSKRIEVACSKLQKGDKRPCCFDGTRCTITEVSKSGVLLDQT